MGITQESYDRLERNGCLKSGIKMLELGAQNSYCAESYGMIAKYLFENIGIDHTSWDIIPHQGALEMDLRKEIFTPEFYDVVTNFGTMEHMDGGLYYGFMNVHNHTKVGGLMVHENPKTGNWPGHGQHYFTIDFYRQLAEGNDYEILELNEEPAMGNITNGWNIACVLRKIKDKPFGLKKYFDTYHVFKS